MGARAVAKVGISFGLTNIRVKLFLSASSEQVEFNMINPKTGNRVKQLLVDSHSINEDGSVRKGAKVINRNETVRGYEYEKGKYVTFTNEEILNMQAEKRDTLDIVEFVPLSSLDPIQIEKTYYTGPDKGADKSYKLFYEILKSENIAAIGTYVARGKEHLVMIVPYKHGLVVHQMFYNSEVRSFDNTCDEKEVTPQELILGKMLVKQMTKKKLDTSKFSDGFIEKVTAAVQVKLDGGEITSPEAKKQSQNSTIASLRAQLEGMGVSKKDIEKALAEASAA